MLDLRGFCGHLKSTKSIHDDINPQQVNDGKWTFTDYCYCKDYEENNRDVYCELVLYKFADIVSEIVAPGNSLNSSRDFIGCEDCVTHFFCEFAALAHAESDT